MNMRVQEQKPHVAFTIFILRFTAEDTAETPVSYRKEFKPSGFCPRCTLLLFNS